MTLCVKSQDTLVSPLRACIELIVLLAYGTYGGCFMAWATTVAILSTVDKYFGPDANPFSIVFGLIVMVISTVAPFLLFAAIGGGLRLVSEVAEAMRENTQTRQRASSDKMFD